MIWAVEALLIVKSSIIGGERWRSSLASIGLWKNRSIAVQARICWRYAARRRNNPEAVLDYVVAHEVAHLAEHNHSRRFWRLVAELTEEMAWAKTWLNHRGQGLLRYGPVSAGWAAERGNEGTQT